MPFCDAKGRDCIEKNSLRTFNCSTTCVGIYADVQWVGKNIEEEPMDEKPDDTMIADLKGKIDDDLLKILLKFKSENREVMKIATGQKDDELDRKKYKMLISEYKKFKTKNVKHFRFNSAANMSTYGEYLLGQLLEKNTKHLVKAKRFNQPSNWWRSSLTRPLLTTSRETRRSRRRPS